MNESKQANKIKLLLYIGIPVILLFVVFRFVLYYFKSDGFSGLSIFLPLLLVGIVVFALFTSVCFAAWVYQDCKKRRDDGVLWAVIVFVTTPFIGMLVYFLRRSEVKRDCTACGHLISLKANYCEECGVHIENREDITDMQKQNTHHLKYLVAGSICLILMLTCLTSFIVSAAVGGNVNQSVTSNELVWNMGGISMNAQTYLGGIWKLDFKSASEGFVAQKEMKINHADTESLYADISCGTVPEGSSLVLWLVQGDITKSVDVTKLSEPLVYSLSAFEEGKIHVRLQINGVENVTSEICIK